MIVRALLLAIPLTVLSALAGCSTTVVVANEENYVTLSHPFTEAGEAEAGKSAADLCGLRKKTAVRTERACTLANCTTSYQCTDSDAAARQKR